MNHNNKCERHQQAHVVGVSKGHVISMLRHVGSLLAGHTLAAILLCYAPFEHAQINTSITVSAVVVVLVCKQHVQKHQLASKCTNHLVKPTLNLVASGT